MNLNVVLKTTGKIVLFEALLLCLPLGVSFIYNEDAYTYFIQSILICIAIGSILVIIPTKEHKIYTKEGFIIVSLSWILVSLLGSLPFYLSGEIPKFIDAFFETVSGFTTTGSTILTDVEKLSYAMLFWRSLTHWIGGIGILVFLLSFLPQSKGQNIYLMRAEVPGPIVTKFVSKVKMNARILCLIYFALSLFQVGFLLLGKMPLFDSIVITFSTAGTGGYSITNASIASYNSAYIDYVVGIFMLIFGVNFNIYYLVYLGNIREALKSEELKCYLKIVTFFTIIITLNIIPSYMNIGRAFRDAFFQVSSIITTTGFITADFSLWPKLSQVLIILLMLVGACAGSTGGGIKVYRVLTLFKVSINNLKCIFSPHSIHAIKVDDEYVENETINVIQTYFFIYIIIIIVSMILLSLDYIDLIGMVTSVVTCLSNVGPGLGSIVGPVGNFSSFSDLSKLTLIFDMLAGRLEIFPMIFLFTSFKLHK
ncbi:Trk system potassium uptake protein trkG [uncultured Clostridium sp.]|nr:Trk system potassium uptake protein trkG [uncultured Clostridium sp.]